MYCRFRGFNVQLVLMFKHQMHHWLMHVWRRKMSTQKLLGGKEHNVQLHVKGKKARYVLQNNCYISISFHFITFFSSLSSSKMLGMTASTHKLLWIAVRRIIQATMQSMELLIASLNCWWKFWSPNKIQENSKYNITKSFHCSSTLQQPPTKDLCNKDMF
jgi:hypothetical protein